MGGQGSQEFVRVDPRPPALRFRATKAIASSAVNIRIAKDGSGVTVTADAVAGVVSSIAVAGATGYTPGSMVGEDSRPEYN
jgi:hypothetical protein